MTIVLDTDLSIAEYRKNHFIDFFLSVVFGSLLGLWDIQYFVPGPLGSVRGGFSLIVWVTSWTSEWLVTPTISMPPLPQHIF